MGGCSSSANANAGARAPAGAGAGGSANPSSPTASAPPANGHGGSSALGSAPGDRKNVKSLSTFNKTKGGSMLINVSQTSMMEETEAEFQDDQHIASPAKSDWKVSKTIKRAPEMHETTVVPVASPASGEIVKVMVAYKTLQGRNPRPPHKPNQDAVSLFKVQDFANLAVFAVFDGHGPFGEHASHFMRSRLHPGMVAHADLIRAGDPQAGLIAALDDIHQSFCSDATLKAGVDPVVSGTTCVAVMFEGRKLHIANVGDSRAILGTYDDATKSIVASPLTDDHKPQRPDEKARLEKSGALLLTEREVRGFGDDSKIYICREKGGDIVYGVLFTRSLGDLDAHNHLGVSAEPEMGTRELTPEDRYIVLGSDGIWDYMTNEEVMEVCVTNADPFRACGAIVDLAAKRWDERDADHRRDDITVMVLKLDVEPIKSKNGDAAPEAAGDAPAEGAAPAGDAPESAPETKDGDAANGEA